MIFSYEECERWSETEAQPPPAFPLGLSLLAAVRALKPAHSRNLTPPFRFLRSPLKAPSVRANIPAAFLPPGLSPKAPTLVALLLASPTQFPRTNPISYLFIQTFCERYFVKFSLLHFLNLALEPFFPSSLGFGIMQSEFLGGMGFPECRMVFTLSDSGRLSS